MRLALAVSLALLLALPVAALVPAPLPEDPLAPAKVTILRDGYGVAHVYAGDLYSLGYGNGYAAAQDRLFMMELLRRAAKGTLSEVFGESMLDADISARNEMYSEAERVQQFLAMDRDAQTLWLGYQDGVNRWLAEVLQDPVHRLPGEFAGLGDVPAPWSVTDSLAIAHLQLDRFGVSGGNEMGNANLLAYLLGKFGSREAAERAFADLAWEHDPASPTTIPEEEGTFTDLEPVPDHVPEAQWALLDAVGHARQVGADDDQVHALLRSIGLPYKWGSNAAILGPEHSASGGALLWGGPQVGYAIPGFFWEVGLHGAGFDVAGVIVPGNPGVVIGRTANAAWSVTSGIADQVDVFAERLNPDDDHEYWFQGAWHDMDCREEAFAVREDPPSFADHPEVPRVAAVDLCRTVHGPVVWWAADDHVAFSKGKAHRNQEIPSGVAWIRLGMLDQAVDPLAAFQAQLSQFAFSFNFHYADVNGHILYLHAGRWPLTANGFDNRLPVPGDGRAEWKGVLDTGALPRRADPQQGWLANWNNLPARGVPVGDERGDWGAMHRVGLVQQAMRDALAAHDGVLTLAQFQDVMKYAATHDPFGPTLTPYLAEAANGGSQRDAQTVTLLRAWADAGAPWRDTDADGRYDDAGMVVYEAWMSHLLERTFRDELGPYTPVPVWNPDAGGEQHAADHGAAFNKFNVLLRALQGHAAALPTQVDWFDDATTPEHETAKDAVLGALHDAEGELQGRFGNDTAGWLEPVHTTTFDALGAADRPTMVMVNRGSYNQFMDWGTGRSVNVNPPGQSGMVSVPTLGGLEGPDPHLTDQMGLYTSFTYKPLNFARADVEAAAVQRTDLLVPPLGLLLGAV